MMNNRITNERGWAMARRVLALALCVLFAAASAHSTIYITAHAGHTHADPAGHDNGASCPVCAHLTAAGGLLKSFSPPAADAPCAFVFAFTDCRVHEFAVCLVDNDTPVRLKVRLNN